MMVSFDFLTDPIELSTDKVCSLYIENQKLFRNTVLNLFSECPKNCGIVFSENYEPLKFRGNISFVPNLYSLDLASSLIKKVYEDLTVYACNYMVEQTATLKADVLNFLENLNDNFDCDFAFKEELDLVDLFKIQCLKPNLENEDIPEKVLEYVKFMNKYTSVKCFVFLNLHSYFSSEELKLFFNELAYLNVSVLLIESKKCFESLQREAVYIVDSDLCEIVEKNL